MKKNVFSKNAEPKASSSKRQKFADPLDLSSALKHVSQGLAWIENTS